jgi:hypothetical protein
VIRCCFDLNHEVLPSGFYDVRVVPGRQPRQARRYRPRAIPTAESLHRPSDKICIANQPKVCP